jgi:hypothetical protein
MELKILFFSILSFNCNNGVKWTFTTYENR